MRVCGGCRGTKTRRSDVLCGQQVPSFGPVPPALTIGKFTFSVRSTITCGHYDQNKGGSRNWTAQHGHKNLGKKSFLATKFRHTRAAAEAAVLRHLSHLADVSWSSWQPEGDAKSPSEDGDEISQFVALLNVL